MQTKASRLWQFARFCIAGAAGGIAYVAALYGLTEWFGVHYIASATVAFVLNTVINFGFQKVWAFKNKEADAVQQQFGLYTIMALCFLAVNIVFLHILVEQLGLWYMYAQAVLLIFSAIKTWVSFVISGYIFKPSLT